VGALLGRGLLAGLAGGLIAFAFAHTFGETAIDHAIVFEQARDAASGLPADPVLVSRRIQSSVGLLTATCVYGLALGGLFALVFAAAQGRVVRLRPRATAAALALAGYTIVFAVPFLKYPANPPGVGDPDTIGERTTLYLAAIGGSILAALVAYRVGRALAGRFEPWYAALGAAAVYVALVVATALALPAVHEVPKGFPADTLWRFRLASLGTQACIWTTLGLGFGVLADRLLLPRARHRSRTAQS
jgi:Probable cobalt transporter subunit (CbtA)